MIIAKAIELLTLSLLKYRFKSDPDTIHSQELGIEALKRIENCRKHPGTPVYGPLPGESMPERGIR